SLVDDRPDTAFFHQGVLFFPDSPRPPNTVLRISVVRARRGGKEENSLVEEGGVRPVGRQRNLVAVPDNLGRMWSAVPRMSRWVKGDTHEAGQAESAGRLGKSQIGRGRSSQTKTG